MSTVDGVIEVESFPGPWPSVLLEMKDFVDLWFLTKRKHAVTVRILISRRLVPHAKLQPHVREFKASLANIAGCRIELKGTEAATHKIEIEYRRSPS
jgi:hypothetical protein